jgi:hypothetical protein
MGCNAITVGVPLRLCGDVVPTCCFVDCCSRERAEAEACLYICQHGSVNIPGQTQAGRPGRSLVPASRVGLSGATNPLGGITDSNVA